MFVTDAYENTLHRKIEHMNIYNLVHDEVAFHFVFLIYDLAIIEWIIDQENIQFFFLVFF